MEPEKAGGRTKWREDRTAEDSKSEKKRERRRNETQNEGVKP